MTDTVINPVALPATGAAGGRGPAGSGQRLPLPVVAPARRVGAAVYGFGAVDCRGRVADRVVIEALGWVPGTRLSICVSGGVLVVGADSAGVFGMTGQGHLRLPAPVRHCCGLGAGDRVLLVAYPDRAVLLVHPPLVLDALVAEMHGAVLGGDLA